MTTIATLTDLAEWVRHTLQGGIHLDAVLRSYLEGTFGSAEPDALLADPYASEAATFFELLFSPDLDVRQDYESRWGHLCFVQEDLRALLESFERPPVMATIHTDGRGEPFRMALPADAAAAFIQRLNLTWQPPAELELVLKTRLDDPHRTQVRSALRHSRVAWQPHQVQLVDLFLAKMRPAADGFESDLDFLCTLLDEFGQDQAPLDFLMAKKRFFFQALCKAQAFEKRLRAGNMEVLMLQGARAAYGDIDQWRVWMRRVDRISIALFGGTRYFQEPLEVDMHMDG
ncbi:MAG: hypothetical protein WAU91_01175 [Desulfatitalea sp.]